MFYKILILLVLLISSLISADVDKRLFLETNASSYYKKILHDIKQSALNEQKDKKLIKNEKELLAKLKKLHDNRSKLQKFDFISLKGSISKESYMNFMLELAKLRSEIIKLKKEKQKIQKKLFSLKQNIQNITKDNDQNLLSFQIEYAFYKISQQKIEFSLSVFEKIFEKNSKIAFKALKNIVFKRANLSKIKEFDEEINSTKDKLRVLSLEKDATVLEDQKKLNIVLKKEQTLNKKIQNQTIKKINLLSILALQYLKQNNQASFFKTVNYFDNNLKSLDEKNRAMYNSLEAILRDFAKLEFGQALTVVSSTKQSIEDLLSDIVTFLNKPLFVYQEKGVSITSLVKFLAVFVIGFLLANTLRKKINRLYHVANISSTKLIANLGFYLLIFLAFIIALQSIGLDLSSLSLIAGALSIGIGFGLQGAVSNLVAGIIIMVEKSVKIGDFIEIDENLKGVVNNIGMRSTTIHTKDNLDIIVPNSTFIKSSFINRTLEDDIRQIHIPFSVKLGTKIKDVERSILKALHDSDLTYLNQKGKKPSLSMIDLNENGIKLELLVWIYNCTLKHPHAKKSDFLKLIYNSLRLYDIKVFSK